MSQAERILVPSLPYEAGPSHGVLSPFEPGTRRLAAGSRMGPSFRSLASDIVLDKDVAVPMRDGVKIYADVLRPVTSEPVPVIIAWSPYGKSQGTAPFVTTIFQIVGLDPATVSGLEKFEGPDPAYWCAHGYAICNPDARGIALSEGDSVVWDRQEGRDCHDLIEWLAAQEWCSGKVAMSGTSYLAISQWFTAAEAPAHLAAINPEEGLSDVYRDFVMRGGIPDLGFARQLEHNFVGAHHREDLVAEAEQRTLVDELWNDKIPDFSMITVPAYVVASYSNTLHTPGTFRAWRRIASKDKWLRIHNTQEWPDYYDEANVEDLRRFFDHYLKDEDNGWEDTPRVRYSLLDLEGGDQVDRPAAQFPPDGVIDTKYYLDGRSRCLTTEAPAVSVAVPYDPTGVPGLVSFTVRFEAETVLVGYPKVKLWVEAKGSNDIDLFVLLQKLDARGTHLQQFNVPNQSAMAHDVTERGASVLRYKGSEGRLRVSARHLDDALSTDTIPAHRFDRVEKLQPGEIVHVEIELFPIGLIFHPRDQLRLVVSGNSLLGGIMPGIPGCVGDNRGQHVIHTGQSHASYLQLPLRTR